MTPEQAERVLYHLERGAKIYAGVPEVRKLYSSTPTPRKDACPALLMSIPVGEDWREFPAPDVLFEVGSTIRAMTEHLGHSFLSWLQQVTPDECRRLLEAEARRTLSSKS